MHIINIFLVLGLFSLGFSQDNELVGKWTPSRDGAVRFNYPNGSDKILENADKIDEMMKVKLEVTEDKMIISGREFQYFVLDKRKDKNQYFTRSVYSCKLVVNTKTVSYMILCLDENGELIIWGEESKIGVFKK